MADHVLCTVLISIVQTGANFSMKRLYGGLDLDLTRRYKKQD